MSIPPVSVPYEITLLSNILGVFAVLVAVSVHYEITLLSNELLGVAYTAHSFSTL